MALLDLPLETIIQIVSLLSPSVGVKDFLYQQHMEEAMRNYHASSATIDSLSLTCKALHNIIVSQNFRRTLIHNERAPPGQPKTSLLTFLRKLQSNPNTCESISQLHICVKGNLHYGEYADRAVVKFLQEVASSLSIHLNGLSTELRRLKSDGYCGTYSLLGYCVGLIILHLPNIQELTLSLPAHGSWHTTVEVLLTAYRTQNSGSEVSRRALSKLKSLSTGWTRAASNGNLYIKVLLDLLPITMRPKVSHYISKTSSSLSACNISALILHEVYTHAEAIRKCLLNCQQLQKFVYLQPYTGNQGPVLPTPRQVIQVLNNHKQTLQTLCLGFPINHSQRTPNSEEYPIQSISQFENLTHLWITATSFVRIPRVVTQSAGDEDEEAQSNFTALLQTLPLSLKRLHLAGRYPTLEEELDWVAYQSRAQRMPSLREIGLEKAWLERFVFSDTTRVTELDRRPALW